MDGSELFRGDRQGRRGGVGTLYVRERFDYLEFSGSADKVDWSWVRIKGKASKEISLWESVLDHPTRMKRRMNYFLKCWLLFHGCQPLFLWESLTCWMSAGNNMVERRQPERFLQCVEENF